MLNASPHAPSFCFVEKQAHCHPSLCLCCSLCPEHSSLSFKASLFHHAGLKLMSPPRILCKGALLLHSLPFDFLSLSEILVYFLFLILLSVPLLRASPPTCSMRGGALSYLHCLAWSQKSKAIDEGLAFTIIF